MHDDSDNATAKNPSEPASLPWTSSPTAREKGMVQRAVTALLDALAPEQLLTRKERVRERIEQHRTATGCVLQGPSAALSVSWFAEATNEAALGELHVLVWDGVVSLRGSPPKRPGASVVTSLIFHPVNCSAAGCTWRETDGTDYDTRALADRCIALLEEQLGK